MQTETIGKELISERQAAISLNIAPRTLQNWREKNLLPTELYKVKVFLSGNIRVHYFEKELIDWYIKKTQINLLCQM